MTRTSSAPGATPAPVRLVCALALDDAARARLDALHPALEVVHVAEAALDELDDPRAEILLAHHLPRERARVPALRWVQLSTAGIDHLPRDPAWDGVAIASASGLYTVPIAEYVLGAILQAAQETRARAAWRATRRWEPRWHLGGHALRGARLLLLGYGSIGREVARLGSAFGMRVTAIKARPDVRADDTFREPGTGDPDGAIPERLAGLDALAEEVRDADFLVVTLPLTAATTGLVDARVLAALPERAWLVNVGRGAVVDERALVDALRRGAIAGAVLDVFAQEPLPVDHPLWDEPRAVLTPHVSGRLERWDVFLELVADNVRRDRAGMPLCNRVDPARGY